MDELSTDVVGLTPHEAALAPYVPLWDVQGKPGPDAQGTNVEFGSTRGQVDNLAAGLLAAQKALNETVQVNTLANSARPERGDHLSEDHSGSRVH